MSTSGRRNQTTKRRPNTENAIGAPSADDSPNAQLNNPSSSAASIRIFPPTSVPSLTTLCIRVFALNVIKFPDEPHVRDSLHKWLKSLPEHLVPRVFNTLRQMCPTRLSSAMITAFFLRGTSIRLTRELPAVTRSVVANVASAGSTLQELEISWFDKYPDDLFASLLPSLPSLSVLVLRGCAKVGPKTVTAAATSCASLATVNLNYTAVTPASLVPLVTQCKKLETLKLAGIPNWSDPVFSHFLSGIQQHQSLADLAFPAFRKLKLRQTSLTSTSLSPILPLLPNLSTLDVSFMPILHLPPNLPFSASLEKLVLTSTPISSHDLVEIVRHLPSLRTLAVGAMGGVVGNPLSLTMTDGTLMQLTEVLGGCPRLESVSLVGNGRLGTTRTKGNAAIAFFIRKVGRRCKTLNLSTIPSLRSSDLSTLLSEDASEPPPALEALNLNNTRVDDVAAPYISACSRLRILELAGTKLTKEGLFPILDACEMLENLDLTSCRGVRLAERRRFFEVWEDER